MSTAVLRYAPPWLVEVVSLNATLAPPLSKSSIWIVVTAPSETTKGVPLNGVCPPGGGVAGRQLEPVEITEIAGGAGGVDV